jgi:signal transduction histidine kinase
MEQVAYQLLKNAADASPPDGTIRAALCSAPGGIELTIEDRGSGIPEEIAERVFDPFSRDGEVGREGGLGLAICYRILVEHGGEMRLSSEPGGGARVTVFLPADSLGRDHEG